MIALSLLACQRLITLREPEIRLADLAVRLGPYRLREVSLDDASKGRRLTIACKNQPSDRVWEAAAAALDCKFVERNGKWAIERRSEPPKASFEARTSRLKPFAQLQSSEANARLEAITAQMERLESQKPNGWQETRAKLAGERSNLELLERLPVLRHVLRTGGFPTNFTRVQTTSDPDLCAAYNKLSGARPAKAVAIAYRYREGVFESAVASVGGERDPLSVVVGSFQFEHAPTFDPPVVRVANPVLTIPREAFPKGAAAILAFADALDLHVAFETARLIPAKETKLADFAEALASQGSNMDVRDGWLVGRSYRALDWRATAVELDALGKWESEPISMDVLAGYAHDVLRSGRNQDFESRLPAVGCGPWFYHSLTPEQRTGLKDGLPVFVKDLAPSQRARYFQAVAEMATPAQSAEFAALVDPNSEQLAFYATEYVDGVVTTRTSDGAITVKTEAWNDPETVAAIQGGRAPIGYRKRSNWVFYFGLDVKRCVIDHLEYESNP